jgi:DNA-binding FadR family transcriptional regulator
MANMKSRFRNYSEGALSSHDQVARALGADIIAGVYPPGDKIPAEAEILERFGISRTVLREVLKTLTAKGLIVSKTRVGTKVLDPSHWNMFDSDVLSWKVGLGFDEAFRRDLAEIRLAIEPEAATLAATRATPAQIAMLRERIDDMRNATESRRVFAEADLAFHQAIGAVSGNALMRGISGVIETALMASFTLSSAVDDANEHKKNVGYHEAIVDAIEARDADGARAAMRATIDYGVARVRRVSAAGKGAWRSNPK